MSFFLIIEKKGRDPRETSKLHVNQAASPQNPQNLIFD